MINRRRFLATAGTVALAVLAGCARITPVTPGAKPGGGAAPGTAPTPAAPAPGPAGSAPAPEPGTAPAAEPAPTGSAPATAGADRPFRVALFSDVHLQPAEAELTGNNLKLARAVDDFIAAAAPDAWVTCGDIADHGVSSEFEAFKQIVGKVARPGRLLVTTGNHEFYDMQTTDDVSVKRFTDAFNQPHPYSNTVLNGIHFVMIADEQWKTATYQKDWCWITPAQLRWLEQVLTEHKDKFTVVFMHQPLNETVTGSQGANAFGGTNAKQELWDLVGKHPQIKLWFSGHTHRRCEATGQVFKSGQTTFVGLGSTAYQLGSGAVRGRDANACQSRLLEIYPDKVLVRTRDHAAAVWNDELELNIARS